MSRGVLVASDNNAEWLLPWWWERYSCCNTLPVIFVDFGMTEEMRLWCSHKGEVISLIDFDLSQSSSDEQMKKWIQRYGKSVTYARKAWFKKPFACLLSPFDETIWIDLDCEILSSLDEMFSYLHQEKELAIWFGSSKKIPHELKAIYEEEALLCNSGVFVFKKHSCLLKKWADLSLEKNNQYFGDQCILSMLIHQFQEKVSFLPAEYNWAMSGGISLDAKVIHWQGDWGKKYIAGYGGIKPLLSKFSSLSSNI